MIQILHERVSNRRNEYENYLQQHISNVYKVYESIKDKLVTESDLTIVDLEELDMLMQQHDASKYEDCEFYPYLYHFYPSEAGDDNEDDYNKAWNHHQKVNPHHWQHWILQKDSGEQIILDMDEKYIIEMLCDWSSFKFKNPESTAAKWYSDNKDKMILSDNTRAMIERYLSTFPEL